MARSTVTGDIFRARVTTEYDDGSVKYAHYGPYSKPGTARAVGKGQTYARPGYEVKVPVRDGSGFQVRGPDGRYMWKTDKTVTSITITVEKAETVWSEVDSAPLV